MTKTRNDLVRLALKNLGALPQGQSPNAEEYNSVDGFVDGVLQSLALREICYVTDDDTISDDVFVQLGTILANAARSEFGLVGDVEQSMLRANQEAEAQLLRANEGQLF